tara:strand:+ start:679 stop:1152 length:474 start_codon:yes stop_codon:yes gene_type:complete
LIISKFDQSRVLENNAYGESVRLSNELRAKQSYSYTQYGTGIIIDVPAKDGFDCETADYNKFTAWLNNSSIKKSASLFWFVIRIMAWRFPLKHSEIKNNLSIKRREEFDLILSEIKKELEWTGMVGYQNHVTLDKSLNNLHIKSIKLRDGNYKSVKI